MEIPEMTVTVLDRALVVGDAGGVAGERQVRPDPEVPERARRRSFTAQYKLDVVAEYDAAATGEKGAVLCREGLYSSHVIEWRRARDAGTLAGPARPSGGGSAGRADRPPAERQGQEQGRRLAVRLPQSRPSRPYLLHHPAPLIRPLDPSGFVEVMG